MVIDHDRLFKELIETFFLDFVDLFLPEVSEYLERDSITFLDKELFTDVTSGESHEADLVVKGCFKGKEAFFLIHIEAQSSREQDFSRRMFRYFARLYDKFDIPVYPVAIFSYNAPLTPEVDYHTVTFPDRTVNHFSFRAIQLNRLNWRDFIDRKNPVSAALMSKMLIAPEDRAKVKIECLRLLATLKLDPARMRLISGFVDMYLRLTAEENIFFERELDLVPKKAKEKIMQIVTSWMEEGMQQGMQREGFTLIIRLLARKLGELPGSLLETIRSLTLTRLEELGEALLDFKVREDLEAWLREHNTSE